MTLKSYYNNQEFRVQSTVSCFIQPGGAQTLQVWTLRCGKLLFHLTFSSCKINSSSSQSQVILRTRTPFLLSHQPLLVVSPCSAVIKLFLNGRDRKKKTSSTFLPLRNLLTGRSCGFLLVLLSLN